MGKQIAAMVDLDALVEKMKEANAMYVILEGIYKNGYDKTAEAEVAKFFLAKAQARTGGGERGEG